MAQYPPGSTFKTIMGLIGLQEEVISVSIPSTIAIMDFYVGSIHTGCHLHDITAEPGGSRSEFLQYLFYQCAEKHTAGC